MTLPYAVLRLTILSVAYPLLPAGPDSAGGAEQILYLLEAGLVQAGHRSIVVAAEGSQISGELIATPSAQGDITDEHRSAAQSEHLRCIEETLARHRIDLIHFHGLDFHTYLPRHTVPKLVTLHLPPAWYPTSIFELTGLHLNCVSQSQADSAPSPEKLSVVVNGIATGQYHASASSREYLLWLGRICPEKAAHIALKIAQRANLPALVAGPVHPFRDHQKYFSESVQPLLDERRRYVGSVGLKQKAELLGGAKCLLIPSLVAETSSLVAMEALSSGTPVIAFRAGALPEVIEDGVTGFVVDSEDEMLAAIGKLDQISGEKCRAVARTRFDSSRMVDDYLKLYECIVG